MSKKFALALFVVLAIAVGLLAILLIGLFRVDEDGRSRDGARSPSHLEDDDPWGVGSFATHHLPLDEAPAAYQMLQEKKDGAVKVVFRP